MKVLLIVIIVAAVLAVLAVIFTKDTPDRPLTLEKSNNPGILPYGQTGIIAHRAGAGLAPENTMKAFENIVKIHIDSPIMGFEGDLHLTKDGEIIILHDDTLDRTSNSEELFKKTGVMPCDITYAELKELNMGEKFVSPDGNMPYKGLRGKDIPDNLRPVRLRDMFDFLAPYGDYTFTVDIKNEGEIGLRTADELHKILVEYDMLSRTAVASFHKSNIKYLDKKYPDIVRSATTHEVVGFYFDSFFNIHHKDSHFKYKYLHIPYKDYFFNLGTTRLVNYAHRHDIAVQYWTINDPKIMKHLSKVGGDALMTDVPDVAFKVLKDIGFAVEKKV